MENDPEFRGYKPKGKENGRNGIVLETPSLPHQNISRRNPLLEDDDPRTEPPNYPPPPPPRSVPASKRPAPPPPVLVLEEADSNGSSDELDEAMNSNFSFGKNVMTEM